MQNIIIKKNVSCRSYNFEKKDSRSYIFDEELKYQYLLENISSDIWSVIVSSTDYDTVLDYAKKHGVEDELNQFLKLLEESNLIFCEKNIESVPPAKKQNLHITEIKRENISVVSTSCTNMEDFVEERTQWIYKNNFLQDMVLQTNYKCDLVCAHCYNEKHHNEYEITFEQAKDIIDQAFEIGVGKIGITGGECTINKDFLKICKYIREKHLSLNFLTNGQKLYDDENLCNEIIDLWPHEIKISLYSMDPEIHDRMTGVKGSYDKTVSVIKKLIEHNISVTINHLQLKTNIESFPKVLEFAESLNAKLVASPFFIINNDNNNRDLRLLEEDLINIFLDKNSPENVYNTKYFHVREPNRTVCRASEVVVSIAPNLDVTPCNDFDYPLGNLNNEKLKDIWNISIPKFRNIFLNRNLVDCDKEQYCKYCLYCPMRGFKETGFLRKSTTACENARAFYIAMQRIDK